MTVIKYILLTTQVLLIQGLGFAQNWLPVGPGIGCHTSEYVWDLTKTQFGDSLLIAGTIASDGNCDTARAVLTWDGLHYNAPGGFSSGATSTLAFEFSNAIYGSGSLVSQPSSNFNIITSGIWQEVEGGFNGGANDYLIKDNLVYLAGAFSGTVNGLVCTFDGEQFQDYYTGPPNSEIAMGLSFYQDTLFVCGGFISQEDEQVYNGYAKCCKIVNGQLEKVAQGFALGGVGWSLKEFQNKLYIGGYLRLLDAEEHDRIYYYENGQLFALPEQPDDLVTGMVVHGDGLYVCGDFHNIGNMPCEHVARWDGTGWTCLCYEEFTDGQGDPCEVQCIKDIEVWKDTLYIGGLFNKIGNTEVKRIAKLDMNLSEAFPQSISETEYSQLSIFPNPTSNSITIQLPQTFSNSAIITICDYTGRILQTEQINQASTKHLINLENYPVGIYLILYEDEEARLIKKFIKE